MSLDNHPNFHACQFTADIMSSLYESLRSEAAKNISPKIMDLVREDLLKFVEYIEREIDEICKQKPTN